MPSILVSEHQLYSSNMDNEKLYIGIQINFIYLFYPTKKDMEAPMSLLIEVKSETIQFVGTLLQVLPFYEIHLFSCP